MKKILSLLFVCLFVIGFSATRVSAEQTHNTVTGTVNSFDREFAKIKVSGKSYRLARTLSIHAKNSRGEIEPAVNIGANVELVFVGSSPSSGVKEIILLDGGRR